MKDNTNKRQNIAILEDKNSCGKKRDWVKYKKSSLAVSKAYKELGEDHKKLSIRMEECGDYLRFKSCPHKHEKKLIRANFCKARLCPMCQRRRSLIMFHQVLELTHEHHRHYRSDIPIIVTLTVPNVQADMLRLRIDSMYNGWHKLMMRTPVKRIARSWFRSLEVTYNEERDDYHPHFHVLILVPMNYFVRSRGLYIERDRWLEMWQESMEMPEITQVDVRRVKKLSKHSFSNTSPLASAVAEVAKYATKPGDYVKQTGGGRFEANAEVIEAYHWALRGRRLSAFGGEFRKYRRELKMKDVEKADMVKIDEDKYTGCKCRVCQSEMMEELYSWNMGLMNYVRRELLNKNNK